MFCGHCGAKNREDDRFCGICGVSLVPMNQQVVYQNTIQQQPVQPAVQPEIVYMEEKPMESILNNSTVMVLTLFFFIVSIVTILCISVITKDVPTSNQLEGIPTQVLY